MKWNTINPLGTSHQSSRAISGTILYLVSESLRLIQKSGNPKFGASDAAVLKNYKRHIDGAIKFIPTWVKVCVALALTMGTMVGWKRIVITVGGGKSATIT